MEQGQLLLMDSYNVASLTDNGTGRYTDNTIVIYG